MTAFARVQCLALEGLPVYEIVAGQCLTIIQVDDQSLYDALGDRCCNRLDAIAERWARR